MAKEIEKQFALGREIGPEDILEVFEERGEKCTMEYVEDQYTSYLCTGPNEVRIRSIHTGKKVEYYLTIKSPYETLVSRTEVEMPITEEQYREINSIIKRTPIHKKCIQINIGDLSMLMSVVDPGTNTSFVFAEIEFDSVGEALRFEWPFKTVEATDVSGKTDLKPGKSMSMPEYWERYRANEK